MKRFSSDSIKVIDNLFILYLLTWIYSGFLRVYFFQDVAQILYFLPYISFFFLVVISYICVPYLIINKATFGLLLALGLIFQSMHLIKGAIEAKTFVVGLLFYVFPFAHFNVINILKNFNVQRYLKILVYSLLPNLFLAGLQTYTPHSRFSQSVTGVQNATTTGGISRAFGTFSSTTGLALYISLVTAILLSRIVILTEIQFGIFIVSLIFLYLLSGSRTIYFSLFGMLLIFFSKYFLKSLLKFFIVGTVIILFVKIFVSLLSFFQIQTFQMFFQRVVLAHQSEDTRLRVIDSLFEFRSYLNGNIGGDGLGSHSIASIGYSSNGGWIENELVRNMVELGPILGIVFVFFRFMFATYLFVSSYRSKSRFRLLLSAAIAPYFLFGIITGQATISIGVWIGVVLLELGRFY